MTTIGALTNYLGTVPKRTQSQSEFNTNVSDFLDYIDSFGPDLNARITEFNTVAGEVNTNAINTAIDAAIASTAAETAIANANATVYSGIATYDYPDVVIGSDGNSYRCLGTDVTGDDPVGSTTGDWVQITADAAQLKDYTASLQNLLLNPGFTINQFNRTIAAATPGTYFVDGWFCENNLGENLDMDEVTAGGVSWVRLLHTPAAGGGLCQLYGHRRETLGVTGIWIKEDDWLTISAEVREGDTLTVYAGYGTASGSNVTTTKVGELTSTTKYLNFQADYGGLLTTYLCVKLYGGSTENVNVIFKNLKINKGLIPTGYQEPRWEDELRRCEYYYQKTYNYTVQPGEVTDVGAVTFRNELGGSATVFRHIDGKIPRMSSNPTVTIYSSDSGSSGYIYNITTDADVAVSSVSELGETGFSSLNLAESIASGNNAQYHVVFDSRL